ncbi:MFS transporter [Streptacidiphilus rugosus]|uniref:MFS transporter n=1 Tax=Streptacidiphilus rugosus TaxID=405783 RepID=UPI000568B8F1|nr:MFS transporter [Streptacidiphilus rugosus]
MNPAVAPGAPTRQATSPRRVPPLRVAAFRSLWTGDAVARLGHQIAQFLLPLLAATALHGTAFEVGAVSAAQFVPVVVLSPAAGSLAGRMPTRTLLVACNLLRGVATAVLAALCLVTGLSFWPLVCVAVVVGSAAVFHDIGYDAAAPRLLSGNQLTAGNGLFEASYSAAQLAGPALAGYGARRLGLTPTASVVTALFLAAIVLFRTVRLPAPAAGGDGTPSGITMRAGLDFVRRNRSLRDLCLQSALFNLHEQAFLTAFMIYGIRSLHLSGGAIGTVLGVGGGAALVGSLVVGRVGPRMHAGAVVCGSLIVAGLSLLAGCVLARFAPAEAVLAVAFVVNGVALAAYNVFALSFRSALPPPQYLGAVTAVYRLVAMAPLPLGALLGGALLDALGGSAALVLVTGSLTLTSLRLLRSPLRRTRTVDAGAERSASEVSPEADR